MRRRETLSALGLFALAGCLAPGAGGENGTTQPTSGDTTTESGEDTTSESGEDTTSESGAGTTTTTEATDWTADLTPVSIECASEDARDARVTFEDATVTVKGTIIGNDMCYRPNLGSVVLDEEASELVIVVESVSEADEDTACAQCISAIEYEAVVTFDGTVPATVVVKHDRDGSRETVTEATK